MIISQGLTVTMRVLFAWAILKALCWSGNCTLSMSGMEIFLKYLEVDFVCLAHFELQINKCMHRPI